MPPPPSAHSVSANGRTSMVLYMTCVWSSRRGYGISSISFCVSSLPNSRFFAHVTPGMMLPWCNWWQSARHEQVSGCSQCKKHFARRKKGVGWGVIPLRMSFLKLVCLFLTRKIPQEECPNWTTEKKTHAMWQCGQCFFAFQRLDDQTC